MKRLIIALTLLVSSTTFASVDTHNFFDKVAEGYSVGYAIDNHTVLDKDMRMWNFKNLEQGYYVAFNLETNSYYYIEQELAQE